MLDNPIPSAVPIFLAVDSLAGPVRELQAFVVIHSEAADVVLQLLARERRAWWYRRSERERREKHVGTLYIFAHGAAALSVRVGFCRAACRG